MVGLAILVREIKHEHMCSLGLTVADLGLTDRPSHPCAPHPFTGGPPGQAPAALSSSSVPRDRPSDSPLTANAVRVYTYCMYG